MPARSAAQTATSPLWLCYSVTTVGNSVGIRELRQQASSVLKRVIAGEVIDITHHGHPIARIVPLHNGVVDQLMIEGRATGVDADLIELLDELTLPAAPGKAELPSRALLDLRAEKR